MSGYEFEMHGTASSRCLNILAMNSITTKSLRFHRKARVSVQRFCYVMCRSVILKMLRVVSLASAKGKAQWHVTRINSIIRGYELHTHAEALL